MHVFQLDDREAFPGAFPALVLSHDRWDDFGYKTTFWLTLWLDESERLDLPQVKVMKAGMESGRTPIPPVSRNGLPPEFASIGSEYAFYEEISGLDGDLGADVARSLNDIATFPDVYDKFSEEDAYKTSLLRLSPTRDALRKLRGADAGKVSTPDDASGPLKDPVEEARQTPAASENTAPDDSTPQPLIMSFEPPATKGHRFDPPTVKFDFSTPPSLPGNLIALTGSNGTGKTTLLSRLAMARFFDGKRDDHGMVTIEGGYVGKVIFVSFSAYDSFEIPSNQQLEADYDVQRALADRGYVYIGLRKLNAAVPHQNPLDREYTLKSVREIGVEFEAQLRAFQTAGLEMKLPKSLRTPRKREEMLRRRDSFVRAVSTLFEDPSMSAIAALPPSDQPDAVIAAVMELFPEMSTGHKALLNIVASLCTHLDDNSLVLLDEPETHLHPPLVASLLATVRILLAASSSNAIVATHSPIVVQETLAQHVLKFSRTGTKTSWKVSETQTFGDNVASLTRGTFGLPAARADYIGVLETLVYSGNGTLEEVEALFAPKMLSSPARAQVLRLIAERRALTP